MLDAVRCGTLTASTSARTATPSGLAGGDARYECRACRRTTSIGRWPTIRRVLRPNTWRSSAPIWRHSCRARRSRPAFAATFEIGPSSDYTYRCLLIRVAAAADSMTPSRSALPIARRKRRGRCRARTQAAVLARAGHRRVGDAGQELPLQQGRGRPLAGEFPRASFSEKNGLSYEPSKQTKSALYVDLLPLLNSRGSFCRAMTSCSTRSSVWSAASSVAATRVSTIRFLSMTIWGMLWRGALRWGGLQLRSVFFSSWSDFR